MRQEIIPIPVRPWTLNGLSEQITIFDSTGTGLQDVAAAALAFERAVTAGRGYRIQLGD